MSFWVTLKDKSERNYRIKDTPAPSVTQIILLYAYELAGIFSILFITWVNIALYGCPSAKATQTFLTGCKVLFTYFYNPVYLTPGGYRYAETLRDSEKVPLHVSIDIGVNESNIYADYIVPDVTYLEGQYGWLNPHAPALKFTGVRAPCIEPLTGKTEDDKPFCLETFLIDLAISLKMPGFGEEAIVDKVGNNYPLVCAEDFYLRAYANIASGAQLPEASESDLSFVEKNYPLAKFRNLLSVKEWRQVCYMLARGGVFKPYDDVFQGETFLHGIEKVVLYNEKLAATRNSLTGKHFAGTLCCLSPVDSTDTSIAEIDGDDYPFSVVTYKMHVHTQSRTIWHKHAMELFPENMVQINSLDARKLDITTGDSLLLRSASNSEGVRGKAEVTDVVRPECVGISFHYGHSQLGAKPITIKGAENVLYGGKDICDGDVMKSSASLDGGTNPNMVGRLDDNLGGTPLVDVMAGIPDFSSTRIKIVKLVS